MLLYFVFTNNSLANILFFDAWYEKVMNPPEEEPSGTNPWEKPGAKQPMDYTMEEFEALTGEQQMAFQKYLGEEAFEEWLNSVLNFYRRDFRSRFLAEGRCQPDLGRAVRKN